MMKHRKAIAAVGLTAALATGGAVGATMGVPNVSSAQDNPTTATPPDDSNGDGQAREGRSGRRGYGPNLEVAAETLGLTVDELRDALQDGTSLADVAADQGVDKQVLIDALVTSGEAKLDEAKTALPERVAEMVDHTFEDRDGGLPGGFGGGQKFEAAATVLGVTVDELRTALEGGKTLADVAADQGVDTQDLIDALVADAKAAQAERVADGTITQEQADRRAEKLPERVTDLVNGEGFGGRKGHGPGRGGPGGAPVPDDEGTDSGN